MLLRNKKIQVTQQNSENRTFVSFSLTNEISNLSNSRNSFGGYVSECLRTICRYSQRQVPKVSKCKTERNDVPQVMLNSIARDRAVNGQPPSGRQVAAKAFLMLSQSETEGCRSKNGIILLAIRKKRRSRHSTN